MFLNRTACGRLLAAAFAAAALAACSGERGTLPQTGFAAPGYLRTTALRFSAIKRQPPVPMWMAFLMTDGSVVTQGNQGNNWYRYAPDASGDYSDGTWTQIATLQSGYAPSAFSSEVLADGRLLITGGEYNSPGNGYFLQLTNLGSVYDPVKNTWTPLGHPHRWKWIGDSPSTILPDGRVLLGDKLHKWDASLDPVTLHWTSASDAGKADFNAEEGWTLLPDGTVLTADVKNAPNSEVYDPTTWRWKSAGSTIVDLHSSDGGGCVKYGPGKHDCYYPPGEIGPAILRPDGTVFYTGSGSGPSGYSAGHTAIYYTTGSAAGTWSVGPDFPNRDNAGDSYAVLEPSGNVLVFGVTGAIYEWNGSTLTQVSGASYSGPPILLPTGQVMMFANSGAVLYTPTGSPKPSWAPTIKKYPKSVTAGKTYKITGTQFNGLSQAMSFGDEEQNATAYPLVRITNGASGKVYYARTHDHSTMAVATGSKLVWTYFDVPSEIGAGASSLAVVANGIASKPVNVTVRASKR
ncbi:MAG: hypothetical protein WA814_04390 [Candidatus Baltobacteraceae bacterium]